MRRLMAISAFALFLAVPLWAQHGGGHAAASADMQVSVAATAEASAAAVTWVAAMSPAACAPARWFRAASRTVLRFPIAASRISRFSIMDSTRQWVPPSAFTPSDSATTASVIPCRGFGYPWAYGGYYDPWWWDSGSSYDEDYERDRAMANQMNQQSLEEQRMLQQEEADGDQDIYARSRSRPPSGARAKQRVRQSCRTRFWFSATSTNRKSRTTRSLARRFGTSLRSTPKRFHCQT